MNAFQSLNLAIFAGTVTALLAGLARITTPIGDRPIVLWLFVAFLFIFRLKLFLDDHKYFGEPVTSKMQFKVGLTLGIASWFFWGLAASSVPTLRDAYGFSFIALVLSTMWIVVANLPNRYERKDVRWIATNVSLLVAYGAVYADDSPMGDVITWVAIGASITIAVLDFIMSKSIFDLPAAT